MQSRYCRTCIHDADGPDTEPCYSCNEADLLDPLSNRPHWSPIPDCDTCQHHNTPDLMQCNACTSVAALTGERWTLHVPAMAAKPRARTISINPAPVAQPEPDTQAAEPIRCCITCENVSTQITQQPCEECVGGMVFGKPYTMWTAKIPKAPSNVPSTDPGPSPDTPAPDASYDDIAALISVAAIFFVSGISFGLLIANMRG